MRHDISVIGPLNIDLLIAGEGPANWEAISTWDGPAAMDMTAAGSVGYTVQNIAKLGLSVQVSSCLSDDPLGAFILDALGRVGVNTALIHTLPHTQGGIGVYMLLFGSRKRPLAYRLPTHPLWWVDFSAAEIEQLLDTRLLHQGGYLHFKEAWHGSTLELFKTAKGRGVPTSMDTQFPLFAMEPPWLVGMEDILPYLDYVFCDESEARNITAQDDLTTAAAMLLDKGAGMVVIKQGAAGSTLYRQGWQHHQAAVTLGQVADTIGAGDTFDAGFLYGVLQGWQPEKSARFASIAAAFTVLGVGGTQTMPTLAQVMDNLEKSS